MNDWIPIKMPTAFSNKYGPLHLCYRTEELDYSEPLADINILIEQKGKHKDDR